MPEAPVIEMQELQKSYEAVQALRGLSLRVASGSIHAFLGRNGAGKTTAIKILMGMTRAQSGEARVFGLSCGDAQASVAIRSRTGFVSEEKDLYDDLTVEEMIRFTRSFYPKWRTDLEQRYLRRFELSAAAGVKALSRGMRTKLALLLVFCRGAELLILDEPTAGLDPAAIEDVLQAVVSHVAEERMTVFFSSHQIAEVEQVADHVTILSQGRAALSGGLDEVREGWRRIHLTFEGQAPKPGIRLPGLVKASAEGRTLTLVCRDGSEQILHEARALQPSAVDIVPLSLKEIFLYSAPPYSAKEENENVDL